MTTNVLVLLASYNGKKWIEEQIKSVLDQVDIDSIQILVRDDCSEDGTAEHIERLYESDSRVTLLRAEKPSGSAGQNFFELIKTCNLNEVDYVAFCDQDDIWFSDKLSRAITALMNTNSQGYSSAVKAFWPSGRVCILKQSPTYMPFDFLFEGAGQGCTFVIPVSEFEKVQKFCNQNISIMKNFHYHDWLTYLIIKGFGGRWFFDSISSMLYRQHSFNETGARGDLKSSLKRFSLIMSGWYRQQINSAVDIYKIIAPMQSTNPFIFLINNSKRNFFEKTQYSMLIALNSRRKLSDRIILAISALFSWV